MFGTLHQALRSHYPKSKSKNLHLQALVSIFVAFFFTFFYFLSSIRVKGLRLHSYSRLIDLVVLSSFSFSVLKGKDRVNSLQSSD